MPNFGMGMLEPPPALPRPGIALIEELDRKVLVQLWDGCLFIGMLRSIDVHGNFVLQDTHQRQYCENMYHDKFVGLQIVRGENIVLMGQIDPAMDPPRHLEAVSEERLKRALEEVKVTDQMRGAIAKQFDFLFD